MARQLALVGKEKPYALAMAQATDFRYRDTGRVEAETVLSEKGFSLYCLEPHNGRVVFAHTPPDVDLTQAPFYFQAQYEHADGLIAVSYDELRDLARQVPFDPSRITMIYSTGRCGSTLVVRALAELGGMTGLSEPDVLTQLVVQREHGRIAQDCLRLLSFAARGEPLAIKPRSFAIELATALHAAFPQMRPVFLYRDPFAWGRSTARAFAGYDPALATDPALVQDRLGRLIPLLAQDRIRKGRVLSQPEVMACQWVSQMDRALALRHSGADLCTISYEELTADPHSALSRLFAHCGLEAPDELDAFLAKDSQADTPLSRSAAATRPGDIDEAELGRAIASLWAQVLR